MRLFVDSIDKPFSLVTNLKIIYIFAQMLLGILSKMLNEIDNFVSILLYWLKQYYKNVYWEKEEMKLT